MDCVVIGGGPGGYVAAIYAAKKGASVTLVEKDLMGGTCLNRGCIPTKAILHSAHAYYHAAKHFPAIGVNMEGVSLDFGSVMKNKDAVVAKLRGGVEYLLKKNGVAVIRGEASFIDSRTVSVRAADGEARIAADTFLIATGSRPVKLPFVDFDAICVLSSDHILQLKSLPATLAIIGGGVIGCEFAQAFARMGVKVSIIELLPRLLANMDTEQSALMARVLKREKVDLYLEHNVADAGVSGSGVTLRFKEAAGIEKTLEAEKLLIAVGREPNSASLSLDKAGVLVSQKGFIDVDEGMRTNVSGIYAIGDVTGKLQLAHVASHQGMIAVENMFGGDEQMNYDAVPQCVYTEPEMASIGKTDATVDPSAVTTGMFPVSANGRAMIEGAGDGFSKVIVDKDSRTILGVHLAGPNVTEMISGITGTINYEMTTEDMRTGIFAHPCVSEIIGESFLDVDGLAIHK